MTPGRIAEHEEGEHAAQREAEVRSEFSRTLGYLETTLRGDLA
jgi:hypothetical protein